MLLVLQGIALYEGSNTPAFCHEAAASCGVFDPPANQDSPGFELDRHDRQVAMEHALGQPGEAAHLHLDLEFAAPVVHSPNIEDDVLVAAEMTRPEGIEYLERRCPGAADLHEDVVEKALGDAGVPLVAEYGLEDQVDGGSDAEFHAHASLQGVRARGRN